MARYVWIGINVAVSKPNKPTPKATVKPKVTPKPTPPKKLSVTEQILVEGMKKLSPSQKKRIADLFGIQYDPRITNPNYKGNPKDLNPNWKPSK